MSASLEAAYRTHGPSVLRRARKILGNEEDAIEVLQDVFVSLVGKPEQFEGRSSLMTFLYRATTNRCLNQIRNAKTRLRLLETKVEPRAEQQPAGAETQAIVADTLRRLPDEQARAVVYYYLDELSQAEIAELMGCSRRHVGNLIDRARTSAQSQGART